jgi:hypothetical protein
MTTLADIDTAPDYATRRGIAVAGVGDQLRRFTTGQADQSYLGLGEWPTPPPAQTEHG